MHIDDKISSSSIRLCFSKYNTIDEVNIASKIIAEVYQNIINDMKYVGGENYEQGDMITKIKNYIWRRKKCFRA